MHSVVDAQLIDEVRRYALRFTCESCAHYDPEQMACGNGFPTEPHRQLALATAETILFCKGYELC